MNFLSYLIICILLSITSLPVRAEMVVSESKPKSEWDRLWKENYERSGAALLKGDYATLDTYYNGRQKAYENGEIDEGVLGWEFKVFESLYSDPASHHYIDKWVQASPNSYSANLVTGMMHRSYGYDLRGSKWASETTDAQFDGMEREFKVAAPYFLKSLTLAEKPVLSYSEILGTFFNANAAMAAFAPKQEVPAKPKKDQTVGSALGQALLDITKGVVGIEEQSYSRDDLHRVMWHYADQGLKIAPGSTKIIDEYFELIKPKWYGSEEMMREFVESQYKQGDIERGRYQYLLASIPWEKAVHYGYKEGEHYDLQKAADFYYETAQFLGESDNGPFYYGALYGYLDTSYQLYLANQMNVEREKKLLPKLDYFIESEANPYKTREGDKEYNRKFAHILDVRAYVRMVHQKNVSGAWADLNESYKRGSSYAAYKVASTYCEGYPGVVEKDQSKCTEIMKESARLGNKEAQGVLTNWGQKW